MGELRLDDFNWPSVDQCVHSIGVVHAFLHGELEEDASDEIREHLMTCERCMQCYDIESLITTLVQRSCTPQQASAELRQRIATLHVTPRQSDACRG